MENQAWFERLDRRLRSQWIPRSYRSRVVQELRDHVEDILDHEDDPRPPQSARAVDLAERLGDAEAVAEAVVKTYRARSFAGRHPFLVFGLSPLVLGPLLWALLGTGVAYLMQWVLPHLGYPVPLTPLSSNPIYWTVMVLCPIPVLLFYAWLALRYAKSWLPLLGSTALLVLFFSSLVCIVRSPQEAGAQGMLMMGLSLPPQHPLRALVLLLAVGVFVTAIGYTRQGRTANDVEEPPGNTGIRLL